MERYLTLGRGGGGFLRRLCRAARSFGNKAVAVENAGCATVNVGGSGGGGSVEVFYKVGPCRFQHEPAVHEAAGTPR